MLLIIKTERDNKKKFYTEPTNHKEMKTLNFSNRNKFGQEKTKHRAWESSFQPTCAKK